MKIKLLTLSIATITSFSALSFPLEKMVSMDNKGGINTTIKSDGPMGYDIGDTINIYTPKGIIVTSGWGHYSLSECKVVNTNKYATKNTCKVSSSESIQEPFKLSLIAENIDYHNANGMLTLPKAPIKCLGEPIDSTFTAYDNKKYFVVGNDNFTLKNHNPDGSPLIDSTFIDKLEENNGELNICVSNLTDPPSFGAFMATMYNLGKDTTNDITGWDVSNLISMKSLFEANPNHQNIMNWDTKNLKSLERTFQLSQVNSDISFWDVSNVETMERTFNSLSGLTDIDLSTWDVHNVKNMNSTFMAAFHFDEDLSSWDVSNVTTHKKFNAYADSASEGISSEHLPHFPI